MALGGERRTQVGMNVCLFASSTLGEYMTRFREAPVEWGKNTAQHVRVRVCVKCGRRMKRNQRGLQSTFLT